MGIKFDRAYKCSLEDLEAHWTMYSLFDEWAFTRDPTDGEHFVFVPTCLRAEKPVWSLRFYENIVLKLDKGIPCLESFGKLPLASTYLFEITDIPETSGECVS